MARLLPPPAYRRLLGLRSSRCRASLHRLLRVLVRAVRRRRVRRRTTPEGRKNRVLRRARRTRSARQSVGESRSGQIDAGGASEEAKVEVRHEPRAVRSCSYGFSSHTGGPIASDATSRQLLGGSSTNGAVVIGASLAGKVDIEIVEDRGDGHEKLLASVPGPAPPADQTGRSASPYQQSKRSPAAGRIGLRSLPRPLAAGQRVSLPSSIHLTDTGRFRATRHGHWCP